jgi:AraC-like DNA-binding protein
MKDTPAVAIGTYRESPIQGSLGLYFGSLWSHELPQGSSSIIVSPDAAIDLQWIDGKLRIAGPDRNPMVESPAGNLVVGMRFRPAAATAWLGIPANELTGRRLLLADLWGSKARNLESAIDGPPTAANIGDQLQRAMCRVRLEASVDSAMRSAYQLVSRGRAPMAPLVPWLSSILDMSERTLRRRFDAAFGYGPKTLDLILRYQRFASAVRKAGGRSLAALALDTGYADQAHLTREVRRLTRCTPGLIQSLLMHGERRD